MYFLRIRLGRAVPAAIAGLVLVSSAVLAISDIAGQQQLNSLISLYDNERKVDLQLRELISLQKEVELAIVGTQEALTDISATQALDGLDDGFQLAEEESVRLHQKAERIEVLAGSLSAPELAPAIAQLTKRYEEFHQGGIAMANAYIAAGPAEGNKLMGSFDGFSDALQKEIEATSSIVGAIVAREDAKADADIAATHTKAEAMALTLAALGVVMIGCGALLAFFVSRRLLAPLNRVTAAMNALADGNSDVELAGAERVDEIGDLARSFQNFRENLIARRNAQLEEQRNRDRVQQLQSMNEAERMAELERTKAAVDALAGALDSLAHGDLTARIDTHLDGEYDRLRDNFNQSARKLQAAMAGITGISHEIRSSSSEMRSASDDLARRTEQQAAALEQTAAALNQITITVKNAAAIADSASRKVGEANRRAEQSDQIVHSAIEAMGNIEQSSSQIGKIIGVIDEIAFQTNLLALNAGVEAARAGEAGKGFAVVAQEVRELAQRSANAAKEIAALIQKSNEAVSSGVSLVNQSGDILSLIQANVMEINGDIRAIVTGAHEQSTGLSEINAAITQMDQVTQQNAAMVEETSAAAHKLAQEAEDLAGQVNQFRLLEQSVRGVVSRAA
ncbi:methyl-accepting chemotaxis protein [Rhizobium sp. S95]|uniref:Methyl-accepting chemotaxis protein n=1 Tax=Ciceribacter sichuanensis TaxID=2949647 RepID=A0AAJ1BWH5_9HYPH|nr:MULTISPECIES: methyl-accepting chemotaxis protein [unclassified Ciceribacter]MCM2399229.1 methyl-accepting chemotaxis protein [Ciceribacter sp. S95]MCO5956565.1 methyl-accepting chemotaxis protein [Ciceribacter sp. S101]